MDSNPPDDMKAPEEPLRFDMPAREIDSRELLQGQREIIIRHGDEAYRLSLTRSGKLLLRK